MGELVKQKVIIPNITVYCIRNLVTKHFDASLECLCILLNTFGKDLEQVNLHIILIIILLINLKIL